MEHAPKSTVQAWKGMRRFLVASKLIPSLVRYSQRKQEMAQRSIRKQELKVRLQKYDSYSDATGDDAPADGVAQASSANAAAA